jgi:hypothetical protein
LQSVPVSLNLSAQAATGTVLTYDAQNNEIVFGLGGGSSLVGNTSVTLTQLGVGQTGVAASSGVFIGNGCGYNTTGKNTTAIGPTALQNATGDLLIAIGNGCAVGASGTSVTFIGNNAGANFKGAQSHIIGNSAANNAYGTYGVYIGNLAGSSSTGITNIAIGTNSFVGSTGSYAICIGNQAGRTLNGSDNICVGENSLQEASGNYSIGIGSQAGKGTKGDHNVYIGRDAALGPYTGTNNICIGRGSSPSANIVSNEITLGNGNTSALRCAVTTITALSDARDKKNVQPLDYSLDFIKELKPVKFDWNCRDGSRRGKRGVGFIAQDVKTAMQNARIELPELVYGINPDKLELGQSALIPALVGAIKELSARVDELYRIRH